GSRGPARRPLRVAPPPADPELVGEPPLDNRASTCCPPFALLGQQHVVSSNSTARNPGRTRLNCPGFDGGCILWEDVAHVSTEAADAYAWIGTPTSGGAEDASAPPGPG